MRWVYVNAYKKKVESIRGRGKGSEWLINGRGSGKGRERLRERAGEAERKGRRG